MIGEFIHLYKAILVNGWCRYDGPNTTGFYLQYILAGSENARIRSAKMPT